MNEKKSIITHMKTLSACTNSLAEKGYTENFKVEDGRLMALSDNRTYNSHEIAIPDFYRFEGQSDPADSAILYVIETPDGKKGMLIDAYGNGADAGIAEFVKQVNDIAKKSVKS